MRGNILSALFLTNSRVRGHHFFRMYLYQLPLSQKGFTASLNSHIVVPITHVFLRYCFCLSLPPNIPNFFTCFFAEVWNGIASPKLINSTDQTSGSRQITAAKSIINCGRSDAGIGIRIHVRVKYCTRVSYTLNATQLATIHLSSRSPQGLVVANPSLPMNTGVCGGAFTE
jgi:hypothetical protein